MSLNSAFLVNSFYLHFSGFKEYSIIFKWEIHWVFQLILKLLRICLGVHIGVQKMHSQLKKEYFWCGMYMDIIKFVRQCSKCVDADLPLSSVKTLANKVVITLLCLLTKQANCWQYLQRRLSCLENPGRINYVDRITRSMGREKSQVWKQVL